MQTGLSSTLIATLLCIHVAAAEEPVMPEMDVDSLPVALGEPTRQISGFRFLEGPVYDPVSQQLIFSDVSESVIYRMQPNTDTWVVLDKMEGCNGLAIGPEGDLYVCRSGAGDVVKLDWDTKAMEVVVDTVPGGGEFNAPNDLIFDAIGGLYFSDPNFKSAGSEPWEQGVYYRAVNGQVHKVLEDLRLPNGVALSPDGDVLYVLPFGDSVLMAYPVMAPGVIGAGRRLAELAKPGDGMAIDTFGNIYVTQPEGMEVLVIEPAGRIVNRFKISDRPSNCAFGGRDDGTLFVTCKSSVWTIPLNVAGHRVTKADWAVVPESHIHLLQYVSGRVFLRTLDDEQRANVMMDLDDPSRRDWNYMPGARTGLRIGELDGNQKMALWQLVSGGLSTGGIETLHQIRMIEDAAHEAGREDVGLDDYWITVYGEPGNGTDWGWRLEGHHVSLNNTFKKGKLVSTTPMFLGAQPQSIPSGMQRGVEPLGSVNAKARSFLMKLNADQQAKAIVSDTASGNITTPMGAGEWSSAAKGIRGSELTPDERRSLLEIIKTQLDHAPPSHVQSMMNEYTKNIDDTRFGWYGGTGDGDPHAWVITGPDLHVEYHDAQEPNDHVHTVWRRPDGDFGPGTGDSAPDPQSRATAEEE